MSGARGQALVETAIAMPFFILSFFAMAWGIRQAVVAERVQSGVRNAGIVLAHADPYRDYSLFSAYNGANNGALALQPVPCASPTAQPLYGASEMNQATGNAYFAPRGGSIKATCNASDGSTGSSGLVAFTGSALASGGVMLVHDHARLQASTVIPAFLSKVISATSATSADANFFRPPPIQAETTCTPGFDAMFTATTDPENDVSTSSVVPTPLPTSLTYAATGAAYTASCGTQAAAAPAPPPPVTPTSTPVPPTPTPAAAPIPPGGGPSPSPMPAGGGGSTDPSDPAPDPSPAPPQPTPPPTYYNGGGGGSVN